MELFVVDGIDLGHIKCRTTWQYFRRRKVGFIFQQYNLIPDLNVYDNIIFPLELDGAQIDKEFILKLLETLNISDKTRDASFYVVWWRTTACSNYSGVGNKTMQSYLQMNQQEIWIQPAVMT